MADTPTAAFGKLVPGFDFLQNLVKNAGSALPSIGQWVAPTLDPKELDKRIEELRTVQFWLEQNARMLGATIQALEVQRMTLSTLQTMNVQMTDLRDSLQIKLPTGRDEADDDDDDDAGPPPGAAAAASAPAPASSRRARKPAARSAEAAPAPAAGVVDPMQWWGALTKQFTELATGAMKEGASETAKTLAGAMVKQSFDAAEQTLKKAVTAPVKAAAKTAAKAGAARRRSPR